VPGEIKIPQGFGDALAERRRGFGCFAIYPKVVAVGMPNFGFFLSRVSRNDAIFCLKIPIEGQGQDEA
jgi:hypothetical protein